MREVPLTKGYVTQIDDEDYERVMQHSWTANVQRYTVYAQALIRDDNGHGHIVMLHRFLLGITDSKIVVDHQDHDGLNNQKLNLRRCSRRQNICNSRLSRRSTSGYKGVTWNRRARKWKSGIVVHRKSLHLGYHRTREDAARAYDQAALKYFGAFASLNFPAPSLST